MIFEIKRIKQNPNEPYCGPITYNAIKKGNKKSIKKLHFLGMMSPSVGFFYTSFHKLDKNITSYIEDRNNFLNKKDIKCFEVMWNFEKSFQKITKKQFIDKIIKKTKNLYSANKKNIIIIKKMSKEDYKTILLDNISKGKPIGVLIMINLNKYLKKKDKFFIPHWVTVHGYKKGYYRVFNSYEGDEWWSENNLFKAIDLNRKFSFSPQFVTKNKK